MRSVLLLAVLLAAPVARAQEAPPYIAVVDGDGAASLEREGTLDVAIAGMPILDGDRLSTTAGRLEVIFPDGSAVDIDEYSSVEFGPPPQFQVTSGRVMFSGARIQAQVAAARGDAFGQWVQARRDERIGSASSAPYLPPDLQSYGGTFDRAGAWQYEAPYGNVWYPAVASDWRPYYHGYWSSLQPYGWTWIGFDRWAWPTHHYGRWGYARSRWFWIPGRTWGPAWVTWASAPGSVSWCPLGFDNRPVFSLNVSIGNRRAGWVTLDRAHFGVRGAPVNRYAIEDRRPPARTPALGQTRTPRPAVESPVRASRPAPSASVRPRPQPPQAEQAPQFRKAVPKENGRPVADAPPVKAVQPERPPERAAEPIRTRPAPTEGGTEARGGGTGKARRR